MPAVYKEPILPSALPTSHAPVVHLDDVDEAEAGLSVFVVATLSMVPVVPEPDVPLPDVVVVPVVVVVELDELAGVEVCAVVSVELLAEDDDDAGATGAGPPEVTHVPEIGSQ